MKKNKYVCGWMAILGRVSTETGSALCRTSLLDCFWITTTRTRFCSLQKHKCIIFPAPFPVARVPGSSLASRLPSFGWKILVFLQAWLLEIFRELEPASFWRENAILVIILLRVLERERVIHCVQERSFITSSNKNTKLTFRVEKRREKWSFSGSLSSRPRI